MGLVFFALFLFVPILEIIGFMQIGSLIGLWPTLGVVILTAIAGSMLLRHQGMAVLFRTQSMIQEGKIPVDEMIDGICLAIAGALLLTPGFFTDIFGFLLFIPPFRRTLATTVFKKYILPRTTFFANGASFSGTNSQHSSDDFQDTHFQDDHRRDHSNSMNDMDDGPIIDGEFTEADTQKSKKPSDKSRLGSPWNDNEDLGNKHK
ncbi:membrane protein FxsA [Hyphomicrobiales bacterium 4NK60-0047b]